MPQMWISIINDDYVYECSDFDEIRGNTRSNKRFQSDMNHRWDKDKLDERVEI